ncbi:MAG TPA: BrnT family toxin [Pseudolabrys sp.]|nr:BrnT family toxin [Pseudolabrys sp.]
MEYEWNAAKAAANRRKHGVGFDAVLDFDWTSALVVADERADYGEPRWLALGLIGERLHSLAFTIRGERIRVISLRAASRKERVLYEEANGH